MKKVKLNLKSLGLTGVLVALGSVSVAQNANPLSQAATEFGNAVPFVQTIMTAIFGMLAGAALVYGAYLAWFKPERLKESAVGLITGFLIGTIGFTLSYLA